MVGVCCACSVGILRSFLELVAQLLGRVGSSIFL
jgi:hypothetical protein